MKLSKRLTAAASFVTTGGTLADVGADRGELSYYLLTKKLVGKVILSDISKNSLNRAVELFRPSLLWEKVEFRVGDGLSVLQPGEASSIVLAGMGGRTVTGILSAGAKVALAAEALVIQAMGNSLQVRRWLQDNAMEITDETIVWEDGHYYTIIKSRPGAMELTEAQAYAGPILLKNREPLLRELLTKERAEKINILTLLTEQGQGKERQNKVKEEITFLNSIIDAL